MLTVTVYSLPANMSDGARDIAAEDGITYDNIDFVSLVNNETYGPPALVAPGRGPGGTSTAPTARPGQRVLYINTNLVPIFEVERED